MSTLIGRTTTNNLKAARRAVNAGRARWLVSRPEPVISVLGRVHPAMSSGPPVAPKREAFRARRFGAGILKSVPSYRMDCTHEDAAWWAEESRREEDRMFDRLGREYDAQCRIDAGLDA